MSGRYVYEHRKKGDVASASPEALDAGKKLLGYLAEQRRLGLAKTLVAQATTADGSVVTARFVGDTPEVSIRSSPPRPSKVLAQTLEGFITKPRKFGTTASATNGQNAFGQHAHVLLQHKADPDDPDGQLYKPLFFDATYAPAGEGIFSQINGEPLFVGGLAAHGNVDWRDASEQVAITWTGNPSRYWLAVFATSNLAQRLESTRVYHNGREILNHTAKYEGYDETIAGACLRKIGGTAYLIYVTRPGYRSDSTLDYPIRCYRVPLQPDYAALPWIKRVAPRVDPLLAPLFVAASAMDVELIGEYVLPQIPSFPNASGYGLATMFFNQSATQARGIVSKTNFDTGFEHLTLHELVMDLADTFDAATFAIGDGVELSYATETTLTFEKVVPNFYNDFDEFTRATDLPDPLGNNKPPAGTYTIDYTTTFKQFPVTGASPVLLSGDARFPVWLQGSNTTSLVPTGSGPMPLAVDFQDDVPVYLWWTPETTVDTDTWSGTWGTTCTASRSDEETYTGSESEGSPASTVVTTDIRLNAAITTNRVTTSQASGGRLYATDKNQATWLEVGTDRSSSVTTVQSAEMAATRGTVPGDTMAYNASGTVTPDATPYPTDIYPVLWWADLRSKSAVIATNTRYAGTTATAETTATTGASMPNAFPTAVGTVDVASETRNLVGIETSIYFHGELVRQMSSLRDESTSSAGSVAFNEIVTPYYIGQGEIGGLGRDGLLRAPFFRNTEDDTELKDAQTAFLPAGYPAHDTTVLADTTQSTTIPSRNSSDPWAPPRHSPTLGLFLTAPRTDVLLRHSGTALSPTGTIDFEPTSTSSEFYPRYDTRWGAWIAHKDAWAYSMFDLDRDELYDPAGVPSVLLMAYTSAIKGGDIETLTGARDGVELYEQMWPLSRCLSSLRRTP